VLWFRSGTASISVRFSRYGPYGLPVGTNDPEWASKTCGFFVVSNTGPRRVICEGEVVSWTSCPFSPAQVRLPTGWTNAAIVPVPGLPITLLPQQSRELCVVLGVRLPGPPSENPVVGEPNVEWKVRLGFRGIGWHERFHLLNLANRTPWPVRKVMYKLLPRHAYQRVWSDPARPQ